MRRQDLESTSHLDRASLYMMYLGNWSDYEAMMRENLARISHRIG